MTAASQLALRGELTSPTAATDDKRFLPINFLSTLRSYSTSKITLTCNSLHSDFNFQLTFFNFVIYTFPQRRLDSAAPV